MLGFVLLGQLLGEGQMLLALAAVALVVVVLFTLTLVLVREPLQRRTSGSEWDDATAGADRRTSLSEIFRLDPQRDRSFIWLVVSRFLFLWATYAIGRFLLIFVANRLGLDPGRAAEETGSLLAALTLVTVLATLPAGWLADRVGRLPLMLAGAVVSAVGAALLIVANSAGQILLFGSLMGLGSAAFAGANWALTADLIPPDEAARFFALANFGTAGAAAAAGLFGPLIDWANRLTAGSGYTFLFAAAAVLFMVTVLPLRKVAATTAAMHGKLIHEGHKAH
jgi:MFS family permease